MKCNGLKIIVSLFFWCSTLPASVLATEVFELHFDALWNATDHPTGFPSGAHFSPIIGASHASGFSIWEPGQLASTGVENVAEVGARGVLEGVIDASSDVLSKIVSSSFSSPSTIGPLTFEVDSANPFVSLITMIAPSPDWFVGVHSLDLRSGPGFVDDLTVDLFAYDAGTENGTTFMLDNSDTIPRSAISLVDQSLRFGGSTPVARLRLNRTTAVPEPSSVAFLSVVTVLLGAGSAWRRMFVERIQA